MEQGARKETNLFRSPRGSPLKVKKSGSPIAYLTIIDLSVEYRPIVNNRVHIGGKGALSLTKVSFFSKELSFNRFGVSCMWLVRAVLPVTKIA